MRKENYAKLTNDQREKIRAADRKWKATHPPTPEQKEAKLIYDRKYYQEHRDKAIAYAKTYTPKWNKQHPERRKAIMSRHRRKLRSLALNAYGGVCVCCGLADEPFLSIDHINSDGAEHRRKENLSGGGYHIYAWLKKMKYPKGFQVLCYNCNLAKQFFGQCPHQSNPSSFKR